MDGSLTGCIRGKDAVELPWTSKLSFYNDIACGMAHIHALGHIHRDLKSGNILMQNGRCKVADFGSVRSMLRSGNYTRAQKRPTVSGVAAGAAAGDWLQKEYRERANSTLTGGVRVCHAAALFAVWPLTFLAPI